MFLMNPKEFDEQQRGIIFAQLVLFAPMGDGLREFLVEVGRLFLVVRAHCLAGSSRSAADSISA